MTFLILESLTKHMLENVVVGKAWRLSELDTLFARYRQKVDLKEIHFTEAVNLETLALELGAYKSKGEARRAGRVGPIPSGWTMTWINKRRMVYIWNPAHE